MEESYGITPKTINKSFIIITTTLICLPQFDLCSPNPCPSNLVCVDKGNSYSCECLRGFTEDNCGPHPQVRARLGVRPKPD